MDLIGYLAAAVVAYLLGSIPTGYLVARARGIDIRSAGSGNIGATNAFRVLGRTAGTIVLTVDVIKGFAACFFVAGVAFACFGASRPETGLSREKLALVTGFTAVLGHIYTCWLRFKGGKGVATTAGVMLAWAPWVLVIGVASWLLVFVLSRYVSLASMVAAVVLPVASLLTHAGAAITVVTAVIGALAIYKHRANLKRLLAGTEHRFGTRKEPPRPAS